MRNAHESGFSLVELLTVVAILGILAVVMLPRYMGFVEKSADGACLAEARAYSGTVLNIVSNPAMDNFPIPKPENKACKETTDASQWKRYQNKLQDIEAIAREPGKSKIICDFQDKRGCRILDQ